MKKIVICLAAGKAVLNYDNVIYNDFIVKRDLVCDMMDVDLSQYDILIATPPCNYYSRANSYKSKETSVYSQTTKHLLPDIIDKFIASGKPFIVENVRSGPLFKKLGLFNKNCFIYFYGRHTYWTNVMFNPLGIPQEYDFCSIPGYGCVRLKSYVQGGKNVNDVFDYWLSIVLSQCEKEINVKGVVK